MAKSFESFRQLPALQTQGQTPAQEGRRPSLASAISTLVSKSVKRSRRAKLHPESALRSTSESSAVHSRASSRASSQGDSVPQATWKRRGQTPDMDDYLSLSQLESVWDYHDSYVGGVEAPMASKSYTFQEIAEAPTIVKHKYDPVDDDSSDNISVIGSSSSSSSSSSDDAVVVDGMVHPALRPTPYLQSYQRTKSALHLLRIQTSGFD